MVSYRRVGATILPLGRAGEKVTDGTFVVTRCSCRNAIAGSLRGSCDIMPGGGKEERTWLSR